MKARDYNSPILQELLDKTTLEEVEATEKKMVEDVYSQRLNTLMRCGFVQKAGCVTNDKYAFLYHQFDTDEMTEEEFDNFITLVKSEKNDNTEVA